MLSESESDDSDTLGMEGVSKSDEARAEDNLEILPSLSMLLSWNGRVHDPWIQLQVQLQV